MTTYKLLTKTEMLQAFPKSLAGKVGKPTMKELIRVLRHLIDSSQSHQSEANNVLNSTPGMVIYTQPFEKAYLCWYI